jgi:type II secretory pathway predicted ATPase ExeA
MYQAHWGLRDTPFRTRLDPSLFYESPTHEEALARLHFLVEQQRCLGLLIGESGSGKSLLLEVAAEQFRRSGRTVAKTSLLGVQATELLGELVGQLGGGVERSATLGSLWQTLWDRLTQYRYEQVDTVLLLDDADQADYNLLPHLVRLVHFATSSPSRLTVVLAGRPSRINRMGRDLLDLAELRIDVEPWDRVDTEQYINDSMSRAGGKKSAFAQEALTRLQELSHGVPRRVNQLADLALIAGAGQELQQIDAEVVQSAYEQLSPV